MKKMNKRSIKYGSYAITATVAIMAIIVLFNAVLGLDFIRNRLRFDITNNKMYSLSEASVNLVKDLNKDVEVIILNEEKNFTSTEILEVLKQYNIKSDGKVTTRFVDVEKDPLFVKRELDPDQVKGISAGSIVVKSGKNNKVVNKSDMLEYDYSTGYPQASGLKVEQVFTGAINNVISDTTPVIYFTTGHGELSPDRELSDLKSTIASNNNEVKTLSLTGEIPEDAGAIMFVSPKTDLLAKESQNLLKYLEDGGDAIFLMDVQTNAEELPNFNQIYERYSLGLNNDFVIEGDQNQYYNDFNVIIPSPGENEVTTNLNPDSLFVYMPNCRSVTIAQTDKEWITTQPLFVTSNKSQSQDLATNETKAGPFLLGALSSYSRQENSRVALIGNATFVTNEWMNNIGDNGKRYIMSLLNWMQDNEDSIYIPTRSLGSQPINLTAQSKFIAFIVLSLLLPLAVIGLGVLVWIRRKHL